VVMCVRPHKQYDCRKKIIPEKAEIINIAANPIFDIHFADIALISIAM
jgi:hypothetical protein